MNKPCPKCGGPVGFQSVEDKESAQVWAIIGIIVCAAFALLMAALKPD